MEPPQIQKHVCNIVYPSPFTTSSLQFSPHYYEIELGLHRTGETGKVTYDGIIYMPTWVQVPLCSKSFTPRIYGGFQPL